MSKKIFPKKLAEKFLILCLNFLKQQGVLKNQEIKIGLTNVSAQRIKELNKEYRGKDESTDILSFSYSFNENLIEGDLILCWEIINNNAESDGIKPEEELSKNLVHGCLHLSNFEHSSEMFKIQDDFIKNVSFIEEYKKYF